MAYLIRYYPNDNETIQNILSKIRDIKKFPEGVRLLKFYKDYDGNTLLDLSCGKLPHAKKCFIDLVYDRCYVQLEEINGLFDYKNWMYGKVPIPKIQIVEELLNCGLDVDHLERLEFKDPDILKLILFKGPSIRPQIESIINKKDWMGGYTALHRAALRGCQKSVSLLLQAGANFGTVNDIGESCISEIDPKTLEKFMNNCIHNQSENKSLNSGADFKMVFDYR